MSAQPGSPSPRRPRGRTVVLSLVLVLVLVLLVRERARLHFDWRALGTQFRLASVPRMLAGVGLIYVCYWLRALRWAVLLGPVRRCRAWELLPWQLIGFTIVGLFGRLSDMARPYLIARRTQTPVATQLAIYSIERAFDLGAAAVLFSLALAFAPPSMPHHEAFAHAGLAALAGTIVIALVAVLLRFRGELAARLTARLLSPLSPRLAATASSRVLDFQLGLRAISTLGEFLNATALSLIMWLGIAAAYVCCTRAFTACPQLAQLSIPAVMLLMATSMGGSLVQLPIVGWFTQTAVLAAALHGLFDVPLETATACGAVLQFVMNLSVVPAGLIAAQATGTGLRAAAQDVPAA